MEKILSSSETTTSNEKTIWERLSALPSQVRSQLKREIAYFMQTSENTVQAYICDNPEKGKFRKWNEFEKKNRLNAHYKKAFVKITGIDEGEWEKGGSYLCCVMAEGKITYKLQD